MGKSGNGPPGLVSEFVNLCQILKQHSIASTQMQWISRNTISRSLPRVKGATLPQVWPVSEKLLRGDETRTRRPPQASHSHPSPRSQTKCGR